MDRIKDYLFYHGCTRGTFRGCKKPKRKPDYGSASGSQYWYGTDKKGDYVIRCSNHWTNVCVIYDKKVNSYTNRNCKRIATSLWKIKTNHKNDVEKVKYDRYGQISFYDIKYCGKCYLNSFTATKVFI
jgi:hypothetical protein